MIDLITYAYNRCLNCKSTGTLSFYKGNQVVCEYKLYNNQEVDRLVCSNCGKEYAIDMSKKIPEPLDDSASLKKFMTKFQR